jgi:hypothetical protein
LRLGEIPGFSEDLDEALGETPKKAARRVFGKAASVHLQNVLGGLEGVDQASQIRTKWGSRGDDPRWRQVSGMSPGQVELALEILLGDLEILQGHLGALMTGEVHNGSKADPASSISVP